MKPIRIITTTVELLEDGEKIARLMLDEKHIACAQITGPITSYYMWEEKQQKSDEYLVTLKTTIEAAAAVEKRLKEIHPYELPEILCHRDVDASDEYAGWLKEEVES